MVTRKVELIAGAVAGATGLALGGAVPALVAGIGAAAITATGVTRLRARAKGPSVYLDAKTKAQMESTLHIAIAASWALRPMIEVNASMQREIADALFQRIVETYTVEVTPYVQDMNLHLLRVIHSGIRPDASMAHVRRRYAPRMLRKDDTVSFLIARHVLDIQSKYGPTQESKRWFALWCERVGIGKYAESMWTRYFGDAEHRTIADWNDARRREAAAAYHDE